MENVTTKDQSAVHTLNQIAGIISAPRKDHEAIAAVIQYIEQRLALATKLESVATTATPNGV